MTLLYLKKKILAIKSPGRMMNPLLHSEKGPKYREEWVEALLHGLRNGWVYWMGDSPFVLQANLFIKRSKQLKILIGIQHLCCVLHSCLHQATWCCYFGGVNDTVPCMAFLHILCAIYAQFVQLCKWTEGSLDTQMIEIPAWWWMNAAS